MVSQVPTDIQTNQYNYIKSCENYKIYEKNICKSKILQRQLPSYKDVIPSISTACQCTTVETLRCFLQCARVCQFTIISW